MSNHNERPLTISASGEIIKKPYGPSRWAKPRRYGCAHEGCTNAAAVLARSGTHSDQPQWESRAHNCCGDH